MQWFGARACNGLATAIAGEPGSGDLRRWLLAPDEDDRNNPKRISDQDCLHNLRFRTESSTVL